MKRVIDVFALASTLASGCALSPTAHIQMAPPEKALAGQLRAEIWSDLQSNAWIGNGNELAAAWANAGSDGDNAPLLHIRELRCGGNLKLLRCQFELLRDGGVATYLGDPTPDKLACKANFSRAASDGGWSIPRSPPKPTGGHSRMTIQCQPAT